MTQTVFPYLRYEDVDAAVEFLTRAFGFVVTSRNGSHVELAATPHGTVYLGGPGSGSAMIYVVVDDVDAHYERAVAAGAQIVREVADQSYARTYGAADPAGNQWYFADRA
jgi:uncharacterized glyoxalase superfamily protein PhnB